MISMLRSGDRRCFFEGESWKELAHPLSIVRFAEGLPQR